MIQVNDNVNPKGIEEELFELLKNTKMDQGTWSTILHKTLSCTDERDTSPSSLPVICQSSLNLPTKAGKFDT